MAEISSLEKLLSYGPVGVVSFAFIWVIDYITKLHDKRAKQLEESASLMVDRLEKRDTAHEGALGKIADSLDRVAQRLESLTQEQTRSSIILNTLTRLVASERLTEKEKRELTNSLRVREDANRKREG